jgi:hypothetical protein
MPGFLNSQIAREEEQQAQVAELTQARAERDIWKARCEALEALLKYYANQLVDLQVRNALLEGKQNG